MTLTALREILHQTPTASAWREMWSLLVACPPEQLALAVDYASEHLKDWPAEIRRPPGEYVFFWDNSDRPSIFQLPAQASLLRTLDLRFMELDEQEVDRLIEAPWFGALEEVDLRYQSGLSSASLGKLLDALSPQARLRLHKVFTASADVLASDQRVVLEPFQLPETWDDWGGLCMEVRYDLLEMTLNDVERGEGAFELSMTEEHNRGRNAWRCHGTWRLIPAAGDSRPGVLLALERGLRFEDESCRRSSCGAQFRYNSMNEWMDWSACSHTDCDAFRVPGGFQPWRGFRPQELMLEFSFDEGMFWLESEASCEVNLTPT